MTRRTMLGTAAAAAASVPALAVAQDEAFAGALEAAAALGQLHAVAIAVEGEVVASAAPRGPSVSTAVNVKSVSKTVVAALTGIALSRGALPRLDATLAEVAPALIPPGADPRVAALTVEDLVTMRAGLERTSGANYGGWVASRDWVANALSRPFVAEPGERFLYSTGSFHVLGAVLSEATGRSLLELARDWLGGPLDIAIPPWTQDPQGRYLGGNNMALSPLAMVRFGEAYRLANPVPPEWVEASWTPRTRSPFSGHSYGYGWFLSVVGGHFVAYARGYGGQMIYVVPSLALTVAVTSDPTRPARSDGHVGDLHRLLADRIVPEAERRT